MKQFIKELVWFGIKEARACIFAGLFFVILLASHYVTFGLPRYDFIFVATVLLQVLLVLTKVETLEEVKVIISFHIIGFILEVFKTHPTIGSWAYPEFGYIKLFNVPLYSGFMYAAVGSYIAQAWKLLDMRLRHAPPFWLAVGISALIYINFFTHHFIPDFRYWLMLFIVIIFFKTTVEFTPLDKVRRMPLALGFVLTAFFIWIAENIATYLGAWQYPDQLLTWSLVSLHKVGSWSLLVIISFVIIAYLNKYEYLHFSDTRENSVLE